MSDRVDAVVIGAGLGGLAAAVTLAAAGRSVVVLERQPGPGGYARCFTRGPYRFDASLRALSGLAPGGGWDGLYADLGIWHRLSLRRLDPLYRLRLPGAEIVAHADWYRYEAELVEAFPAEADGIRGYLDEVLAVYHDLRRMRQDQAAHHGPDMEAFSERYPAAMRVLTQTWDQMMARHVSDPRARSALGALWGYLGLPPGRCSALVGAGVTGSYHEHGGWYPAGGSQSLTDALVDVLRERGGTLLFSQVVSGIEWQDSHIAAVTTSEGLRLAADTVISGASAPATMLDLVGRDRLPAEYAARVAAPAPSNPTFAVYLGLDRDIFAEQDLGHELLLAGSPDAAGAWRASQRGDWQSAAITVTDYAGADPGCAPHGQAAVVITVPAAWEYQDTWGTGGDLAGYHDNPRYLAAKEQVADALVARAARDLPGLDDAIRYLEASTPLTNFDYTGNPRGAIEGYENSPEYSGAALLPQETPVPNLYLAGAWTTSGGMNVVLASGARAAALTLQRHPAHT